MLNSETIDKLYKINTNTVEMNMNGIVVFHVQRLQNQALITYTQCITNLPIQ